MISYFILLSFITLLTRAYILPSTAEIYLDKLWPANSTLVEQGESYTIYAELHELKVNISTSTNSTVMFDLFLPTDWNGRYVTFGNGGFSSEIDYSSMSEFSQEGFAVAGTNTGHDGLLSTDGSFALDNAASLQDWGWRSIHLTTKLAKALVEQHYNESIAYSYYSGGSTGGRQGLKEIQVSPESFDGILVGSPAWWANRLYPWIMKISLMNIHNTEGFVSPSLFDLLHQTVIDQCDGLDGVTDSLVDPDLCNFKPEVLLCSPGQNKTECLTSDQIKKVKQWYRPYLDYNMTFISESYTPGTEGGFDWYLNRTAGDSGSYGDSYFKYFVYNNPNWNPYDYNFTDYEEVVKNDPGNATANDFDAVLKYAEAGGKIIMTHGTYDPAIPHGHAVELYDYLLAQTQGNTTALGEFFKLYLIPGMGHVTGGDSPWYVASAKQAQALNDADITGFETETKFNAFKSLMQWVENGTAPDTLIATKYVNDTVASGVMAQRPLCVYPQKQYYTSGNISSYESYVCK